MRTPFLRMLLLASSALAVQAAVQCARGQATLPEITVTPPKEAPKTKPAPKQPAKTAKPAVAPTRAPTGPPPESPIVTETKAFNAARENILPKIGVSNYEIGHQDIEALPQGTNAPLDKVLLQAPGVTMDSAASGSLHVRNEHCLGRRVPKLSAASPTPPRITANGSGEARSTQASDVIEQVACFTLPALASLQQSMR